MVTKEEHYKHPGKTKQGTIYPELVEWGGDAKLNARAIDKDPEAHRRILEVINAARRPEDLLPRPPAMGHGEGHNVRANDHGPEDIDDKEVAREKKLLALRLDYAAELLAFRDKQYPLGFRNIHEFAEVELVDFRFFDIFRWLTSYLFGAWQDFAFPIPKLGPNSYQGVIHAAMCNTGEVLFITAAEDTMVWNPNGTTAANSYDVPTNQPRTMPNGYSQLCGHHVFLSNGDLLSLGGGGYGPNSAAKSGYVYKPSTKTWRRTSNDMVSHRWYPTAVALGDERVLVTCGDHSGRMEIYSESTDQFTQVTGDDRHFSNLYPGMHLLPNHKVFYSRTGWGSAGQGGSPTNDGPSAYFEMSGGNVGTWHDIQPATSPNRTKGMSVLILRNQPPHVRVMTLGGVGSDRSTYEVTEVSSLSSTTNDGVATAFPDGLDRSLASAILLPDGNVFVAGGVATANSPCSIYDPDAGTWATAANLASVRHYHSVAILLPSGQIMMAGWNNTKIEVYSPPYLFRGARPRITNAPALVHHGRTFRITSPDASAITKVVLVRPMAVTHQTDSEQKVIEMPNYHDHADPDKIVCTAPDGGHPHSYAQKGHYMMFALNANGVPSEARWIFLH